MSAPSANAEDTPLQNDWPDDGLESLSACPICGHAQRELLHRGLRDRVFCCAPGLWNLYACASCGTGYLNPRPDRKTIGLAYSRYFTHAPVGWLKERPPSAWRRHRIAQRNAYLNANYGYQLTPASRVPFWLSTGRRQRFDKYTAFLSYPGKGARVLDVGCGNGCSLLQMRGLGWEVAGVEPDPKSAAQAVASGLDVRAGLLEEQSFPKASFDAITMNHVIEHLHDPLQTLRVCQTLLKPGGRIFIATPNLASEGHRVFGPDWFALDPPRHLILFTAASLRRALEMAGFEPEPALRLHVIADELFTRSMNLREGRAPVNPKPPMPWGSRFRAARLAKEADRATRQNPEVTEELVQLARRPDGNAASKPKL